MLMLRNNERSLFPLFLAALSFAACRVGWIECFATHPLAYVTKSALLGRQTRFVSSLWNTNKQQGSNEAVSSSSSSSSPPQSLSIADYLVAVVAPLRYVGPYACLGLNFPKHNATLGFLLDTGANVNSINARVANKLDLPLVWAATSSDEQLNAPTLIGTGGTSSTQKAGDLVLLGDCELNGLPPEQTTTFMTNLTAAALPLASPVGQGLLGLSFFQSFPAGVEFDWHGTDGDPPTLIFFYGKDIHNDVKQDVLMRNMSCVPLQRLHAAGLLTLTVHINGVDLPAILDTGSPITALNPSAAEQAGIDTVPLSSSSACNGNYKNRQEQRQQLGDEALKVAGVDGTAMDLRRSSTKVQVSAGDFSFGGDGQYVYLGDLPGLTMIGQVSATGGLLHDGIEAAVEAPIVVLGLDSLRRTYRMILRVSGTEHNEVWFEALGDQKLHEATTGA